MNMHTEFIRVLETTDFFFMKSCLRIRNTKENY